MFFQNLRSEIADALRRKFPGSTTKMVQSAEDSSYWLAHRLVALYAHDIRYDLDKLTFRNNDPPSVALQVSQISDARSAYALREAAAVMARAVAIPCMARFDKEQREPPKWLVPEAPQLGQCAILKAYVEEDLGLGDIVDKGFDEQVVRRTIGMVDASEHKRRQAPPGIKITPRNFGRDRRMPIANRFMPF